MEGSNVNESDAPATIISLTPVEGWRLTPVKGWTIADAAASVPVIALALIFREPGDRPEVHPLAVVNGKPVLIMDGYELHNLTR